MNSSLPYSDVNLLQVKKLLKGSHLKLIVQITSQNKGLWKILFQKEFLTWEKCKHFHQIKRSRTAVR